MEEKSLGRFDIAGNVALGHHGFEKPLEFGGGT